MWVSDDFNFQCTRPGGKVEQRRYEDYCQLRLHLETITDWVNTSQLGRDLGWSKKRVRETLRTMRSVVERLRRIGDHGALEDCWKLRTEVSK